MGLVTGARMGIALFSRRTVDLCRLGSCLCLHD